MPPRKKTAVAKRKGSTPIASSPNADPATAAPESDSQVENDQARKLEPITTEGSGTDSLTNDTEEESSQPDLSEGRPRRAKKRAVSKVAVSSAKSAGSVSEKDAEAEKSEGSKELGEEEVVMEVNGEEEKEKTGEEEIEKIDGEKDHVEEPVKEEVKGEGEKIVNFETVILNTEVPDQAEPMEEVEEEPEEEEVEEEPVEEEPVEEEEEEPVEEEEEDEEEPIEEEPVEEEEPVRREPIVEELLEEHLVVVEQHVGQEPIIEEPTEDEEEEVEEEDEDEEVEEEDEDEEVEEEEEEEEEEVEEEDEVEEEPMEEEVENNEEKKDIVAVKDVQPASLDRGGGGEDQGLGDVPEPTMYMKDLLPNSRVKEAEIFISQLEKTVVEEDISKVFARFGEIQSVRVIRHSLTQKSKGYAFLQYSTAEAAEKALSELKDGAEIKGKTVHISATNQENCTLFVGNICKSWSRDQVLDTFKGLGVEGIEHMALPEDPKVEGKTRGFAFVEFGTHIDAKAALNRLCKPDAVLGCDFSAKVSFAQHPVEYSEDLLSKVKTVYLEPVPISWDGKKIEEICKEYGAIEQIKLFRKSRSRKKRDFAFVEFVSRDSALDCVEGLNKALDGQDDTKVHASLAKPFVKNTGSKFMIRGNFKVKESNENVEKVQAAKVIKRSSDEVGKEVKIIEVSEETKKKHKKPILKQVVAQKSKALSPQKAIKKNKKAKKVPDVETTKEVQHRHVPNKRPVKEAPVPVQPQGSKKRPFKAATVPVQHQGSKKRPFKEAPESSKRPTKGSMKHKKGMQGGSPPYQSGSKKSKPFKDRKQNQRNDPAFNNERGFKRSRNLYHGDYHSHGSPIDRRPPVEYAYAPPEYTSRIHEPSRHESYAYAPGSYHSQRSDLAPHAGYVPPTRHVPRTRHVYEQSAPALPAPYGSVYERAIVYTREPPIPPTSHPGYATYPRYEQPSYPYSTGGSYPADYAPRRSYY